MVRWIVEYSFNHNSTHDSNSRLTISDSRFPPRLTDIQNIILRFTIGGFSIYEFTSRFTINKSPSVKWRSMDRRTDDLAITIHESTIFWRTDGRIDQYNPDLEFGKLRLTIQVDRTTELTIDGWRYGWPYTCQVATTVHNHRDGWRTSINQSTTIYDLRFTSWWYRWQLQLTITSWQFPIYDWLFRFTDWRLQFKNWPIAGGGVTVFSVGWFIVSYFYLFSEQGRRKKKR